MWGAFDGCKRIFAGGVYRLVVYTAIKRGYYYHSYSCHAVQLSQNNILLTLFTIIVLIIVLIRISRTTILIIQPISMMKKRSLQPWVSNENLGGTPIHGWVWGLP